MPIERDVRADVQMRFVLGVLRAARAKGKNLLLLPAEDGVEELRRLTRGSAVDGVLAMEIQIHDPRVPILSTLTKPVVLIGTPEDPQHLAHVDFDFTAAGTLCAQYLADLGHRTIAYFGQPKETFDREVQERDPRPKRRSADAAPARHPGRSALDRTRAQCSIRGTRTPIPDSADNDGVDHL